MANTEIIIDQEKLVKSVPSTSSVKDMVLTTASKSTIISATVIIHDYPKILIIYDKGALKTGNDHFVKVLYWYSCRK